MSMSVIVVAAPSSGTGKTTVTCGLIAAFAARGLDVRCFKCGPDFLDGMQHQAALDAGWKLWKERCSNEGDDNNESEVDMDRGMSREQAATKLLTSKTVNLDGWMQGSSEEVLSTFIRHSSGGAADVCIIEGVMGLHDSRDGTSDDGSTAQIAKILNAPVCLVVDASACARSVAATALGHCMFDPDMRLGGVVANMVSGSTSHTQWIREAIELAGETRALKDSGTNEPVLFLGGLPKDTSCFIPERHLGLKMPTEESRAASMDRFEKLAILVEENLDLDALLKLGRTCTSIYHSSNPPPTIPPVLSCAAQGQRKTMKTTCRIGIADDAAFCFYYADNLRLLTLAGAELVPFSPLNSQRLPYNLDGLYLGGGYPELYASQLEKNIQMRRDIKSFCDSGAAVFAECGGLMYLADTLIEGRRKDDSNHGDNNIEQQQQQQQHNTVEQRSMCGVFPGLVVRMTPNCTMYYAEVEFTKDNPLFQEGTRCRGQEFHFSEVMDTERPNTGRITVPDDGSFCKSPMRFAPMLPGAKYISGGYAVRNTFASYLHLHFASLRTTACTSDDRGDELPRSNLAINFVDSVIRHSPRRKASVVSFVSAATEVIFALGKEDVLSGVTSICDYPADATLAPRRIICRSRIDASTMTSKEVANAVQELKKEREASSYLNNNLGEDPPGHWIVDTVALKDLAPKTVFVQNTCAICDASSDDVMHALKKSGLLGDNVNDVPPSCKIVPYAPKSMKEMFDSIFSLGSSLDAEDEARSLITTLQTRLDFIETEVNSQIGMHRPRVLSLEGLSPLCTGGCWLPDVKKAAGCEDALGDIGGCPPRILTWDDITRADPDVLLISPCSASPTRTMNELHLLASSTQFWALRCVQRGHVYILDHSKFSRPGPRLVEGAEMLAALLRGIKFDPKVIRNWEGEAFKYEYDTSMGYRSHCTTELAMRFKPCFSGESDQQMKRKTNTVVPGSISKCKVTRCTIPGFPLPCDRSAHTIVPTASKTGKDGSLILFGGETSDGLRMSDVWKMTPPSRGWAETAIISHEEDDDALHSPLPAIGTSPIWEKVQCGKVYGENVPTPRSNHASVVCGDYLLVFGGWGIDNVVPLSHCELLHLETYCWTHCSTSGGVEPPPRGNPTLVFFENIQCAVLFGGWNANRRFNDTWCLDMVNWKWEELTKKKDGDIKPTPRTDHTSVMWENTSDRRKDTMILFGGTIEGGSGATSELWSLEYSSDGQESPTTDSNDNCQWRWTKLRPQGHEPPARTSHAATILGEGNSARMVIVGGTHGAGLRGILRDAYILHLNREDEGSKIQCRWTKLEWSGYGVDRCRHSMAAVEGMISIWGGFDGDSTVSDNDTIWLGDVGGDSKKRSETRVKPTAESISTSTDVTSRQLQERWEAEIPVTIDDIPPEELAKVNRSKIPGAMFKALHRFAVSRQKYTYIDPSSGYSVFTSVYLKKRQCCGNACRHCPHGHINVPGKRKDFESQKSLEW